MRKLGWLPSTETAGVWEFAPAAHAGPIGYGDPYLELRPRSPLTPASTPPSATPRRSPPTGWRIGPLTDSGVAVLTGVSVPRGLRRATWVITCDARLEPDRSRGVPVHRPATILVHLAARPADVHGWGAIAEVLPDFAETVTPADVDAELAGRPRSVRVRLA